MFYANINENDVLESKIGTFLENDTKYQRCGILQLTHITYSERNYQKKLAYWLNS
jgi:hypothetical protein